MRKDQALFHDMRKQNTRYIHIICIYVILLRLVHQHEMSLLFLFQRSRCVAVLRKCTKTCEVLIPNSGRKHNPRSDSDIIMKGFLDFQPYRHEKRHRTASQTSQTSLCWGKGLKNAFFWAVACNPGPRIFLELALISLLKRIC